MKKVIKYSTFLIFAVIVCTAIFYGCGCNTTKQNPLVGWQKVYNHEPPATIVNDYQDYIHKLPTKDNNYVSSIFYYENGTGQHAISIEIFVKEENASWHYVLIYNQENKRINAIKYGYGRYQS